MIISDAMLALLLAAKIHGTNAEVRATAKRCAQRLPRSKRFLMFSVIDSRDPLELIAVLTTNPDEWHGRYSATGKPIRVYFPNPS